MNQPTVGQYPGVFASLVVTPGEELHLSPRNSDEGNYFSRLACTGRSGAFVPYTNGHAASSASIVRVCRIHDPGAGGPCYGIQCTGRLTVTSIEETESGELIVGGTVLLDRELYQWERAREQVMYQQTIECLGLLLGRFDLASNAGPRLSATELAWLLCSSDLLSPEQKANCLGRTNNLERIEIILDAAQHIIVASLGRLGRSQLVN